MAWGQMPQGPLVGELRLLCSAFEPKDFGFRGFRV